VWSERALRAIAPAAGDVFVEIGPGQGALTLPLATRCRHVLACEIDRDLVNALQAAAPPNVTVIEGDALMLSAERIRILLHDLRLTSPRLRVAGNLPYNVASPILFLCVDLVESGVPLVDAVVMVQRELADRILAPCGTAEYGVLSILLRHVARVERRLNLPPGAFRPAPDVHSSLIALTFHVPTPPPRDVRLFRALVRAVFTRRRKMLTNALLAWTGPLPATPAEVLAGCGIDPRRRPETLEIAEFVRLADAVAP
jgi:16S rRNA (adenine1518-N6/adenine1519-N6)-dimethyltransferase